MSLEFSRAGDAIFFEIILDGMEWEEHIIWMVVSNIFYFHPYLGKIPSLTNILQTGWNHQLVMKEMFIPKRYGNRRPFDEVLCFCESDIDK